MVGLALSAHFYLVIWLFCCSIYITTITIIDISGLMICLDLVKKKKERLILCLVVQVQNSPCERKFGRANFSSTFLVMVFQTVIVEKLKKKQCPVALKVAPFPSSLWCILVSLPWLFPRDFTESFCLYLISLSRSIIFVPRKQEVTLIFWG